MYHGIINVYKEAGYTSHDVVAKLRGICRQKKIGHTGTLDPDAVGVLPVCLGNATKLCDMLTDRQKEFFDLYYNEDLSLAEIAENSGISRQGVRDVIVRAEGVMQEIEDKTGLIRRFPQMQTHIAAIQNAAAELKTINYRQYEDARIDALADTIHLSAQALRE